MSRPLRRGSVLALVLVLATASAAFAHPSFNPNRLPAGEAVDVVLVIPHGCNPEGGMPDDGAASPTVVLDLQLAAEITAFEPHDSEGWRIERVSDGEVVRWTATDGGTTEPIELPVTITLEGPVDEELYLAAFQECEEGSFRWIGTPDQEAEFPAVKLTTTAGEIGTEEMEDGHVGDDQDDHADHSEDDHAEEEQGGGSELAQPTGTPPSEGSDAPDDLGGAEESAEPAGETGLSWVLLVVVLLVLVVGAVLIRRRRSREGSK